jgi:hypothetical protein
MKPSTATRVVRNRLGSILEGYRFILAFARNDRPGKGHRGVWRNRALHHHHRGGFGRCYATHMPAGRRLARCILLENVRLAEDSARSPAGKELGLAWSG